MNIFHFEKVHKAVTKATVFASSVFMASDVISQDATIEEVVVTAQKKSENLQVYIHSDTQYTGSFLFTVQK